MSASGSNTASIESQKGMVVLNHVTKTFRGGRDRILDDVHVEFPAGKLTYILGPSGAGKSVTIKLILGLLKADSGQVKVSGQDMATLDRWELQKHREQFGMLFQNSALFDDMTIYENVAFPLWEHTNLPEDVVRDKVSNVLKHLGMPGPYDKFPNEISGGMKKRVGLARAIIREPSILLYDEPTTGLDPVTRTTVDDLIAQLKNELKLTSIVISHDIPSALLVADQIAFLYKGKFVFWGKPEDFRHCDHEAIQGFLKAEERTLKAFEVGAHR